MTYFPAPGEWRESVYEGRARFETWFPFVMVSIQRCPSRGPQAWSILSQPSLMPEAYQPLGAYFDGTADEAKLEAVRRLRAGVEQLRAALP